MDHAPDSAGAVAELIEQIGRAVHGDGFCDGLNPAQWAALRYFARANRFSRTVSAFAAFHGSTRGTASQTVKSLVQKGCLVRRPVEGDRRSFSVEPTAEGLRRLTRDPLGVLAEAAAGLATPARAELAGLLVRLLDEVLTRRRRPRFGVCACCCHLQVEACPGESGPHLCGLLQEPLSAAEIGHICTNYREAGAAPVRPAGVP
jgi:DNA-binding MarR family transcriptional regulator